MIRWSPLFLFISAFFLPPLFFLLSYSLVFFFLQELCTPSYAPYPLLLAISTLSPLFTCSNPYVSFTIFHRNRKTLFLYFQGSRRARQVHSKTLQSEHVGSSRLDISLFLFSPIFAFCLRGDPSCRGKSRTVHHLQPSHYTIFSLNIYVSFLVLK